MLSVRYANIYFLFLWDEHRGQIKRMNWPLEVSSPLHPAVFQDYFCRRCFSVISLRPGTPSSLVPSPTGINREVFIPLENFSFNLSFLCSSAGAKSSPLRESSWRAHACLYGEWFTDVYREWIDQRQSHDRRSIKHQIKDGNPRAEHKLKIRHFSLSFFYWDQHIKHF